jgi:hypothetical protein
MFRITVQEALGGYRPAVLFDDKVVWEGAVVPDLVDAEKVAVERLANVIARLFTVPDPVPALVS